MPNSARASSIDLVAVGKATVAGVELGSPVTRVPRAGTVTC